MFALLRVPWHRKLSFWWHPVVFSFFCAHPDSHDIASALKNLSGQLSLTGQHCAVPKLIPQTRWRKLILKLKLWWFNGVCFSWLSVAPLKSATELSTSSWSPCHRGSSDHFCCDSLAEGWTVRKKLAKRPGDCCPEKRLHTELSLAASKNLVFRRVPPAPDSRRLRSHVPELSVWQCDLC